MSRCQSRSRKRNFVASAEILDDRLVLNASVPAPATPLPAASPISVAQVRKFERALERVDHGFMAKSKHLKAFVINRTDQLQSVFARLAARAQVQVQEVSAAANASSPVGMVSHAQALNNQLEQIVSSFNSRVTQLNNSFEQQLGIHANPLSKLSLQLGVPANALENNFQLARAGLTSTVNTLTSSLQSQASAAASQISAASSTLSNLGSGASSTSATTGASTMSTTTGIGVIATQQFSNAFTQAFSAMNAAMTSVDTALSQALGAFQTQFNSTVTHVASTFSTSPAANLQPTVGFVSGTGVTFSSP